MLRTVVRLSPTFIFPIFENKTNDLDRDMINSPLSQKPQTGWERVKAMYTRDEYDEVSVELHNVVQSTLGGVFIGACFGGFVKSKDAYIYFIENNQATIFKSTMDAKKKLQDYVTLAFAKGAYRWGWKVGLFTGLFSATATTISVYRGDTSLIEYITAGALTGALYKVNLGLAAAFVGAGLGAVLSAIGGLTILGILKISGLTMDDIRHTLYKIKQAREDQYNQAVEKSAVIKNDDLTKHHDLLVEEKGEMSVNELI